VEAVVVLSAVVVPGAALSFPVRLRPSSALLHRLTW